MNQPITRSLVEFVGNFETAPPSEMKKRPTGIDGLPIVNTDYSFEPVCVQSAVGSNFHAGEQHDAEELITSLLDKMHTEMVEIIGSDYLNESNKEVTPISQMFFGSSVTESKEGIVIQEQRFTMLSVSISNMAINSIDDALLNTYGNSRRNNWFANNDNLVYTSLNTLPEIMLVQMKRFSFSKKTGQAKKVEKAVNFSQSLQIPDCVLTEEAAQRLPNKQKKYKLVGVIYHEGDDISCGHYTCDVYNQSYRCWIHNNDGQVYAVKAPFEQEYSEYKSAYILMYRRMDTFPDAATSKKNKKEIKSTNNVPQNQAVDNLYNHFQDQQAPKIKKNNKNKRR